MHGIANSSLDFDGQVTDTGLAHFERCKKLETLGLSETRVTNDGLASFKDSYSSGQFACHWN